MKTESKPVERGRPVIVDCCVAVAVWMVAVMFLWSHHGSLLGWDEIDYVSAARLGVVANAFERGSLSSSQFLRFAVAKIRGGDASLPSDYDEQQDPWFMRHYHPPFVVFLLAAVSGSRSERVLRLVQLLGALTFSLTVILSYRSITDSPRWSGLLLVSLFTVWMSIVLFKSIWFHGWEAVWSTAAAALLSLSNRPLAARRNGVAVALGVVLALALLTIETGVFVWAGALLWFVIERSARLQESEPVFGVQQFVVLVTVAVLVVGVAWPGSITKISLVKNFATHGYSAWLGREYVSVDYAALAKSLLPILVLASVSVLLGLFVGRSEWRRWGPFVIAGTLYGVGLLLSVPRVFSFRVDYLGAAFAPLACVIGAACDRVSAVWARSLLVIVGCVLIVAARPQSDGRSDQQYRVDLQWLGAALRDREALVDGGHIYQYYLGPEYKIRPLAVTQRGNAHIREMGRMRELRPGDINDRIVVLAWYRPQLILEDKQSRLLLEGCRRTERATIRMYDCRLAGQRL